MKRPLIIAVLLLTTAVVAGVLFSHQTVGQSDPPSCPEASQFPPEWASLKTIELEEQLLAMRVYPPSQAQNQIVDFRKRRDAQPAEVRACLYRGYLEEALLLGRHVGEMGESWGQLKEVDELKKLLREAPLTDDWSAEEREHAIDFVETHFVATRPTPMPGDADYWRRMYLGELLLCQSPADQLKVLHARRKPLDCNAMKVK